MNRDRRKEAGKVFLDLSKYLATTVAISGLLSKESVGWIASSIGCIIFCGFIRYWGKNHTAR